MSITRILTYSQVKGASVSLPCRVATTANITLSGAQTIDSIPLQVGDRVLVKDQNTGSENGIYVVSLGAWSRAVDMSLDDDVFEGLNIYVSQGVTNGPKFWVISTPPPVTLSNLTFVPDQEIHGTSGTSGTSGTFGTSGTNGTSGGSGTSGTSGTIGTSASSGTSGTNGTSGLSDSSGTSGTSGESSTQGSSGTSATSGSNGTSGTNGLSFTSGTGGTSGTSTSSGTSGTSATSGSNGISGTSGSGGVSGTSGSIGTSGSSGNSGVRGSSGTNGTTGTSGSSGTSGNAGARGVSGSSGTTGNTGPTGPTGSQGPTGPTGLLGAQGAPGPSGPQGPTGFIGPQGAQGPRGAQGSVGAPGTQGPQGPTGPTGATGFQGPPGPLGPPGPTGPPGPSGTATVNAGTTDAIPYFANSTSVSPSIMFSKSPGPFNGIAIGPNTISPWVNTRMFPIELRINSPAAQSCIFPDGTGNTIWNGANLYFNNVSPSLWAFATSGWGSIISQTTGLTSGNTGAFTTWYTPNISSGADTNLPVFNAVWQVQSSFATAPTYTTNGTCTTTGSNGRLAISSNSKMKIFDGFIEDGLGMLMKMLPRYFYWRDTATYGEGRHLGFYAQELSEISEEISNKPTTEDGQWAIDDRAILAVITKSNQEMEVKINILKSKILIINDLINQAKNKI